LGIIADYSKSYEDLLLDVTVRMKSKKPALDFLKPLMYRDLENIDNEEESLARFRNEACFPGLALSNFQPTTAGNPEPRLQRGVDASQRS
jgi:hypothetical protein